MRLGRFFNTLNYRAFSEKLQAIIASQRLPESNEIKVKILIDIFRCIICVLVKDFIGCEKMKQTWDELDRMCEDALTAVLKEYDGNANLAVAIGSCTFP